MKITKYTTYVTQVSVDSVPCCRGMFEYIDSRAVIVRATGVFVSCMTRDIKLWYCPCCGTKVELHDGGVKDG